MLADLTAATAGAGGLYYGTQSGADRKFTLTAAGATLIEAADAAAQRNALSLGSLSPFIIPVKNITALTTGAGVDIATIPIPSWCTRYTVAISGSRCVRESGSGSMATANFSVWDLEAGDGDLAAGAFAGPGSDTATVLIPGTAGGSKFFTASTLYLFQSTNSGNAGVISVYLMITPLL